MKEDKARDLVGKVVLFTKRGEQTKRAFFKCIDCGVAWFQDVDTRDEQINGSHWAVPLGQLAHIIQAPPRPQRGNPPPQPGLLSTKKEKEDR